MKLIRLGIMMAGLTLLVLLTSLYGQKALAVAQSVSYHTNMIVKPSLGDKSFNQGDAIKQLPPPASIGCH